MASQSSEPLVARLIAALPAGLEFTVHHFSAPPASCPSLFSAPPNEEPEPTECESHFLSVSIDHESTPVQAFAVEVLIYTTASLTTIFVSKADSTGYLHLANLAKGSPSTIKTVISTFLEYLVEDKRRKDVRLVLSLFARAQNQYLFSGSIENPSKHVLDDRGLIRWWCKIFDSILQKYPSQIPPSPSEDSTLARGYLVVPGCDAHETRMYLPRPINTGRWKPNDPLRELGKSLKLPERCLIPRFPDDPKARFALDLDDELPENGPQPMNSPEKNPHPGKWRSVRSIEQFWELMAFRQECAAGRLVGFLWGLFESEELRERPEQAKLEENPGNNGGAYSSETLLTTPEATQLVSQAATSPHSEPTTQPGSLVPPLSSQSSNLISAPDSPTPLPAIPTAVDDAEQNEPPSAPKREPIPTPTEIGSLRLTPPSYNRVIDSLMDLDYADLSLAKSSTGKFVAKVIEEATEEGGKAPDGFGVKIVGARETVVVGKNATNGDGLTRDENGVATLGAGLVRKKRPAPESEPEAKKQEDNVNLLSAGLVRKKPKV